CRAAVRKADLLRLELDRQRLLRLRLSHHLGVRGFVEHDRQYAVLEAVREENLAEARRDDASDAEVGQRPDRLLPARAGTESLACDQDLGPIVGRDVEDEAWSVARAIGAALVEQLLTQ